MEISFKKMLDSPHFIQQKGIIFKETNQKQIPYKGFAPISGLPVFWRIESVDYSVFKKTQAEKELVAIMKREVPV